MQTKQGKTFAIINGTYGDTGFYNAQTTYLSIESSYIYDGKCLALFSLHGLPLSQS